MVVLSLFFYAKSRLQKVGFETNYTEIIRYDCFLHLMQGSRACTLGAPFCLESTSRSYAKTSILSLPALLNRFTETLHRVGRRRLRCGQANRKPKPMALPYLHGTPRSMYAFAPYPDVDRLRQIVVQQTGALSCLKLEGTRHHLSRARRKSSAIEAYYKRTSTFKFHRGLK